MVGAVTQRSERNRPNQGQEQDLTKRRACRGRFVCTCRHIEEGPADRSVFSGFPVWGYILTGPHCGSRQVGGFPTTSRRLTQSRYNGKTFCGERTQ